MFSESDYNEADLARSLLFAISNDIGQIACLYAMMHNLKKVLVITYLIYHITNKEIYPSC